MLKRIAKNILEFCQKSPVWGLTVGILGGLVLLGGAIESAGKIWDTRKLFTKAQQDTDAIAGLRNDLQRQKDSLDILLRDSNSAYREIAATRLIANEAKKQIEELDSLVKGGEKSVSEIKNELSKTQRRNEITALADRTIANADVSGYRKIEEMLKNVADGNAEFGDAIIAEAFRVYAAYSPLAPSRGGSLTIIAKNINSVKAKEDELDADEIMGSWYREKNNGFVRAKLATLLANKAKQGSFKSAAWIVTAIKAEDNLEAMAGLRKAFQKVTAFSLGRKLDNSDLLVWWESNNEDVRSKDTDNPTTAN